jgi:hypothetical protein
MTEETFSNIVREILIPSIDKTIDAVGDSVGHKSGEELKRIVCKSERIFYDKYEKIKGEFKATYMQKGGDSIMNRHKIAALFYASFIDIIKESEFSKHENCKEESEFKNLFVHNAAFNAAIGIVEGFIYFGKEKKYSTDYCSYIEKHGIVTQNCYNIKNFIEKSKRNEPFILSLAGALQSIESNSKVEFEKTKKETLC